MPQITGLKETALSVSDLERSFRFYRELFDFPVMTHDARFCAFNVADSQVLLLFTRGQTNKPTETPGGIIPPHGASGNSHIAFSIPAAELESWQQRLATHSVVLESTVTWPLGGTSLYFRDPDEHLLELMTPGVWPIY